MRIDRLLFFLRFARSRTIAQRWVNAGHMRLNGRRVLDQDTMVSPGDVLTLPLPQSVCVVEILSLPERRGPAEEARTCYRKLDAAQSIAIAGAHSRQTEGKAPQ